MGGTPYFFYQGMGWAASWLAVVPDDQLVFRR
jgi:hypothetical protein